MNNCAYQRIRLWSGIVSIGCNLGLIGALYLSAFWWEAMISSAGVAAGVLAAIPFLIAAGNLPFDILTGHAVETFANRTRQPLREWFSDWSKGAIHAATAQAAGLLLFFLAAQFSSIWKWPIVFGIVVVVVVLVLLQLQRGDTDLDGANDGPLADFEARLASELKSLGVALPRVRWIHDVEIDPVNGCIPPFGCRLHLSSNVSRHLTPREAALLCLREVWIAKSGRGRAGAMIAGAWLLAGVGLALTVPAANAIQAALGGAAVVSLWSFLALFVWPPLNRRWMSEADRILLQHASTEEIQAVFKKVQKLNATDTALSSAKTAIFHPIPPTQDRINALL